MKNERDAILTCSERQFARASGLRQIWVVGREAVQRLISDEAFSLAGNIAFRAILSIFPFLIFLTSLAGFVGTPNLANEAVTFLLDIAPKEIVKGIAPEIRSLLTVIRPDLMSLGVLLTIWTASGGVDSLCGLVSTGPMILRNTARRWFCLYRIFCLSSCGRSLRTDVICIFIVFAPVVPGLL